MLHVLLQRAVNSDITVVFMLSGCLAATTWGGLQLQLQQMGAFRCLTVDAVVKFCNCSYNQYAFAVTEVAGKKCA